MSKKWGVHTFKTYVNNPISLLNLKQQKFSNISNDDTLIWKVAK